MKIRVYSKNAMDLFQRGRPLLAGLKMPGCPGCLKMLCEMGQYELSLLERLSSAWGALEVTLYTCTYMTSIQ